MKISLTLSILFIYLNVISQLELKVLPLKNGDTSFILLKNSSNRSIYIKSIKISNEYGGRNIFFYCNHHSMSLGHNEFYIEKIIEASNSLKIGFQNKGIGNNNYISKVIYINTNYESYPILLELNKNRNLRFISNTYYFNSAVYWDSIYIIDLKLINTSNQNKKYYFEHDSSKVITINKTQDTQTISCLYNPLTFDRIITLYEIGNKNESYEIELRCYVSDRKYDNSIIEKTLKNKIGKVELVSHNINFVDKIDENKLNKYFVIQNTSNTQRAFIKLNCSESHIDFYTKRKEKINWQDGIVLNSNSIDTVFIKFYNLKYKIHSKYDIELQLKYKFDDYGMYELNYNIPISYRLNRKIILNDSFIRLNQRLIYNKIHPVKIILTNTGDKDLKFYIDSFNSQILVPKKSKKTYTLNFMPNRYIPFVLNSADDKDFSYEIPMKYKLVNEKGGQLTPPKIKLDSEVVMIEGEKGCDGKRDFKIYNVGEQPLLITNCSGSCGCIVPTCPREPILPGKYNIGSVKYDTNRIGPISKTITIMSNDPERPNVVIMVKGNIFEK